MASTESISGTQIYVVRQGGSTGILAGLIGCVLAVLGILFVGVIFVPGRQFTLDISNR